MNLIETPFTEFENNKKYKIFSFEELGIDFNILNEENLSKKIPSGNFYKFGLSKDNRFFWYFNGIAVTNSREKMREIYINILEVNKNSQNIPFIYKVKKL